MHHTHSTQKKQPYLYEWGVLIRGGCIVTSGWAYLELVVGDCIVRCGGTYLELVVGGCIGTNGGAYLELVVAGCIVKSEGAYLDMAEGGCIVTNGGAYVKLVISCRWLHCNKWRCISGVGCRWLHCDESRCHICCGLQHCFKWEVPLLGMLELLVTGGVAVCIDISLMLIS